MSRIDMMNGAMSEVHLARFNAVREFDNYRINCELNGVDVSNMMSRRDYVRFLVKATPEMVQERLEMLKNINKEQVSENINNNKKRKWNKKRKKNEVDDDVSAADLFPGDGSDYTCTTLDLKDPEVIADLEDRRRKAELFIKKLEKKWKDKREEEELKKKEKKKKMKKKMEEEEKKKKKKKKKRLMKKKMEEEEKKMEMITRSEEMSRIDMMNGAMSEFHLARFNAVRAFDNHRINCELDGVDVSNMMSRREYVRFLNKAPPEMLQERLELEMLNNNKEQVSENINNNKKRKWNKKWKKNEVDDDVSAADLFPGDGSDYKCIELDVHNPAHQADLANSRRKLDLFIKKSEKEWKEKREEEELKKKEKKKKKMKKTKRTRGNREV